MAVSPPPAALFLINKPAGPTSHDVVQWLRRWSRVRRVGHGGTLDPFATGLLPLFVGSATRLSEYLHAYDKRYDATVRFGLQTDTDDCTGAVLAQHPLPSLTPSQMESAADRFRGAIAQTPPAFSAVKVGGVAAYRAARRGAPPALAPRTVQIHNLTLVAWEPPDLRLHVRCSSGTYLRAIARDLGLALGCGAHLAALRRTAIGRLRVEEALQPDALEAAFADGRGWTLATPLVRLFADWPTIVLDAAQRNAILHGGSVLLAALPPLAPHALALDAQGAPVAVLLSIAGEPGRWRPGKVLAAPDAYSSSLNAALRPPAGSSKSTATESLSAFKE